MSQKNKLSISKLFKLAIFVFPAVFNLIQKTPRLIAYRAKTTTKNLILIIILAVFCTLLLTISWIGILGLIFIFFLSFGYSVGVCLSGVVILNTLLLILIAFLALRVKNRLFKIFPKAS